METGLDTLLGEPLSKEKAKQVSAGALAYIGDTVFDLLVRSELVRAGNRPMTEMNRLASEVVNARNQSRLVEILEPLFTEEEAAIYRRGRNAKTTTHAKNASIMEYRRATGLESVFGYLFLCGEYNRIKELYKTIDGASLACFMAGYTFGHYQK